MNGFNVFSIFELLTILVDAVHVQQLLADKCNFNLKKSLLFLSSALTVQIEHGEYDQARVADAFQHPGRRAGGQGPCH